jgi:hypothetical protein
MVIQITESIDRRYEEARLGGGLGGGPGRDARDKDTMGEERSRHVQHRIQAIPRRARAVA